MDDGVGQTWKLPLEDREGVGPGPPLPSVGSDGCRCQP